MISRLVPFQTSYGKGRECRRKSGRIFFRLVREQVREGGFPFSLGGFRKTYVIKNSHGEIWTLSLLKIKH